MFKKFTKSLFVILAVLGSINFSFVHAAEWVSISGKVKAEDGTLLCAMVLANGQHMFSCDPTGEYSLDVPLNDDEQIVLHAFCEGQLPFKKTLEKWQNKFDISMSACAPEPTTCENIGGTWSDDSDQTVTVTMLGQSQTDHVSGLRSVSVGQTACDVEWDFSDTDVNYKRTGMVKGNIVSLFGDVTDAAALADETEKSLEEQNINGTVTFSTNTHTGEGTISGNNIDYKGSGDLSGTLTYNETDFDITVSITETSVLTKNNSRRETSANESADNMLVLTRLITDFIKEMIGSGN